jgi:hypothetical protein
VLASLRQEIAYLYRCVDVGVEFFFWNDNLEMTD